MIHQVHLCLFCVASGSHSVTLAGPRSAGRLAILNYPAVPVSRKPPPNTAKMQGLNIAGLKKHPSLIPLFVCLGAGVMMSALYTLRLAVRNPDVTWKHVANPEPQKEWADRQYKFYSPTRDYSTYKAPVPKFEE